ncbi:MAG TPA: S8 family serine peptidase [Terriglobales bacterium]|nr:S8 family serine peptidase [Terriglobales bacterium]
MIPQSVIAQSFARMTPTPRMHVPGELIVRFAPNFLHCIECLARTRRFSQVTGRPTLDEVLRRHRVSEIVPLFREVNARTRPAPRAKSVTSKLRSELDQVYVMQADREINLLELAADLRRDPLVVSAEPNFLYEAAIVPRGALAEKTLERSEPSFPDDPFLNSSGSWGQAYPDLWGLFQIGAPSAWEVSQGDGVVVAVLDTGVDVDHEDLSEKVWRNLDEDPGDGEDNDGNGLSDDIHGWDFTTCVRRDGGGNCVEPKLRGPNVGDPVGHGTHVSGIIAATGSNGIGIIGVAPHAQIMPVKVLDESGFGALSDISAGFVYAAEMGARVINASFAGPPSDCMRLAIEYAAVAHDAVVIAAAGNGPQPLERGLYPAILPQVLAIGALTHTETVASGSNYGGGLDLVAPGGGGDDEGNGVVRPGQSVLSLLADGSILSTETALIVADKYARTSGTSMAAPHVSGVAALVLGRNPGFSRVEVTQVLIDSAQNVGEPGWDRTSGHGRVDAAAAVAVQHTPVGQIESPENDARIYPWQFPIVIRGVISASRQVRSWVVTVERPGVRCEIARGTEPVDGILAVWEQISGCTSPGIRYDIVVSVEDGEGRIVHSSRTVRLIDQKFAAVPFPDRFGEGGFSLTMDAMGQHLGAVRASSTAGPRLDIYDVNTRQIRAVSGAQNPVISPDGRFASFSSIGTLGSLVVHDIDAEQSSRYLPPHADVLSLSSSDEARIVGFTSRADLDPTVGNDDRSREVFLFDRDNELVWQLSNGSAGSPNFEPQHVAVSRNGRTIAYVDRHPRTSRSLPQVFVYDTESQQTISLTGPGKPVTSGQRPSISADGNLIAVEGIHIAVVDVASGSVTLVSEPSWTAIDPQISANGAMVAFSSRRELDTSVGNPDESPELFVRATDGSEMVQVTDNITGLQPEFVANGDLTRFLVRALGRLPGPEIAPDLVRLVPVDTDNQGPILDSLAASGFHAKEGQVFSVPIVATDPNEDYVTVYAELQNNGNERVAVEKFALVQTTSGQGTLTFIPHYEQAGTYRIRLAAFDDHGGWDARTYTLTIDDTPRPGDANCDGRVEPTDVDYVVAAIFTDAASTCDATDVNGDGVFSAADLSGSVMMLLNPGNLNAR